MSLELTISSGFISFELQASSYELFCDTEQLVARNAQLEAIYLRI